MSLYPCMPIYIYRAVDMKGKTVNGTEVADTKQELASILQTQGLLLVSATDQSDAGEATSLPTPLSEQRNEDGGVWRAASWPQRILVLLIFIGSLGGGLFIERRTRPQFAEPEEEIYRLLSHIKPGMSRTEIEKWLPQRSPEPQPSGRTRYIGPYGKIIQIDYDDKGGAGSPNNRHTPAAIRLYNAANLARSKS
jgi:hypothetical protein